jgi:hypothetical protein
MNPVLYAIVVLMLVAVPVLIVFDGRNASKGRAYILAKQMFDLHLKVFETETHEYREMSIKDYPSLDAGFYESTTRELEAQGFRILGDIENTTIGEATGARSPMRVMADETCSIVGYCADVYSPKTKRRLKLIDFTTEFSDGHFLMTNNSTVSERFYRPPQMDVSHIPNPVSATELLSIHRRRVEEFHSQNPKIDPKVFNSVQHVIEGWSRSRALRVAFRKTLTVGELRQEVERASGVKNRNPRLVAAIAEEYEKLYRSHRAKS